MAPGRRDLRLALSGPVLFGFKWITKLTAHGANEVLGPSVVRAGAWSDLGEFWDAGTDV